MTTATPATPSIKIQFGVAGREVPDKLAYRPASGKSLVPLTFYSGFRAAPLDYKGSERIEFYAADSTDESPRVLASCVVPKEPGRLLFLFFRKPAPDVSGLVYDVVAVDDTLEKIGPGSFAVINTTRTEYAGHIVNGGAIPIAPGVTKSYPGGGVVDLKLAVNDEGRWIKAGRREFNVGARSRVWVILYPSRDPGAINPIIKTLAEDIAPSATTPAAERIVARLP